MSSDNTSKILLLTHGGWGMSLVKGIEMILGKVNCVHEIPLMPTYTLPEYMNMVQKYVNTISSDSIIITDILGGTPSNVAAAIGNRYNLKVFTGLNAPMLLEACSEMQNDGVINPENVLSAGQHACVDLVAEVKKSMER